jgi:DNA invertase Pin-like site-specific DNA recombinase
MRVAIYARVSSERQEKEHTIGSQLEALRNYAAQNGMEVVEEFTDEGYSGARLDRPALDRMRDLAERRGFEVLLTYCTDRLARKFVLQALILEEMERFGVKTIFLEGGAANDPLSKLMHQITGAVAEFERAKIVERNRRGKLYRARCGEVVTWRAPFGYVRIPRRDGVAPHVEIDENKAVVVRRIFNLYAKQGWTVRQIPSNSRYKELRRRVVVGNGISIAWIESFIMRPMLARCITIATTVQRWKGRMVTRGLLANALFGLGGNGSRFRFLPSSTWRPFIKPGCGSKIIRDSLRGICRRRLIFYGGSSAVGTAA